MHLLVLIYFFILTALSVCAQEPDYSYQKEPLWKGDTAITDYFPNLRQSFILPNGFYQYWRQDTLRLKKDSSLFSGVIRIHHYIVPYEGKVVPASTASLSYTDGILLKESTEEYCYSAYYTHKDSTIIYGVRDNCFGTGLIEKPDSISAKRIHQIKSWDKVNGYSCITVTRTQTHPYYRGKQPTTYLHHTEDSTILMKLVFYRGVDILELEIEKSDSGIIDVKSDKVLFVINKKELVSEAKFLILNQGITEKFSVFLLSPEESKRLGYDFIMYHTDQFNPFREKNLEKILAGASTIQSY